jgi:stress-induced-phosphoprotein 1
VLPHAYSIHTLSAAAVSRLLLCLLLQAYKKRDYATALEHYTAAIKLDPDNVAARNNRSMAYLALNMFKEAAADTSAVLQADPTNVKALLRQAAAHEGLGQQQEAAADWRRVLELEPKNADAQQRLAKLQETQPQQPQQQGEFPPPPEAQQG